MSKIPIHNDLFLEQETKNSSWFEVKNNKGKTIWILVIASSFLHIFDANHDDVFVTNHRTVLTDFRVEGESKTTTSILSYIAKSLDMSEEELDQCIVAAKVARALKDLEDNVL